MPNPTPKPREWDRFTGELVPTNDTPTHDAGDYGQGGDPADADLCDPTLKLTAKRRREICDAGVKEVLGKRDARVRRKAFEKAAEIPRMYCKQHGEAIAKRILALAKEQTDG